MTRNILINLYVLLISSSILAGSVQKHRHRRFKKIVGGNQAERHAYPYHVVLLSEYRFPYCGASLITPNFVLTVAHCFGEPTASSTVLAGAHNLKEISETHQERAVTDYYGHPAYIDDGDFAYDIGLIYVKEPFTINNYVKTIKLSVDSTYPTGLAIHAGWGRTIAEDADSLAPILQVGVFDLLSFEECEKIWSDEIVFPRKGFCYAKMDSKLNTCFGDSGGPVIQKINGEAIQIGVISFIDDSCTNVRPAGGLLVSKFSDWIEELKQNMLDTHNLD